MKPNVHGINRLAISCLELGALVRAMHAGMAEEEFAWSRPYHKEQTASQHCGSVPCSVKKHVPGSPMVPRATRPSPVFCLPQWSADIRLVTGAILLVIPREGIDHLHSPSMAQTRCC